MKRTAPDSWSVQAMGTLPAESILRAPEIRPEGYRLKVTRRGIDLTALDSAGLFYGRQTLCLLATAQGIPCVEIIDNPCFGYRGIHLDVSRHFFPVETIFRLLDEMARYKLNKFHFHLADNGGWRIRIDAYPLLTRLGAFRTESDWLEWWSYGDRHYVPEDIPGPMAVTIRKRKFAESLPMLPNASSR